MEAGVTKVGGGGGNAREGNEKWHRVDRPASFQLTHQLKFPLLTKRMSMILLMRTNNRGRTKSTDEKRDGRMGQ